MNALQSATRKYLEDIRQQRSLPNSTEELSYRTPLENYLNAVADALGKAADFTNEGKLQTVGRPDFIVTQGLKRIGEIEAEKITAKLDTLTGHAKSQNDVFIRDLPNFILTNHFHFRLYKQGKVVANAILPTPPENGTFTISETVLDSLQALFDQFLSSANPVAVTPQQLAAQLASRAKLLRHEAAMLLSQPESPLAALMQTYKQTLFAEITPADFADVYAQTFVYGLFLAWLNFTPSPQQRPLPAFADLPDAERRSQSVFDRRTALETLPDTVPTLQVLMDLGAGRRLPKSFEWIIDGICNDLQNAERTAVLQPQKGLEDPMIHFYEPFLAAYDPQLRERAGVYYTPDAVVDFLIRAVHDLLVRDFGRADGLADSDVHLLDPATGTATFLARAYRQVKETLYADDMGGTWSNKAINHVAKHFYGFERLPAAYTLAHAKLLKLLRDDGITPIDRLPVYLVDTLISAAPTASPMQGVDTLIQEIRDAIQIRDRNAILAVVGNPPYNVNSANPSRDNKGNFTFIGKKLQDYYLVNGVKLGEKNPKSLQDDYVKFIRFAQWRIETTGQGVVAFVTNNSYLDSVTFRGMRLSLLQTFDEIMIVDLHGNSNMKERSPEGTVDENVFDIMQGVAIALFIRKPGNHPRHATVRHTDLYGKRETKYALLRENSVSSIKWEELAPDASFYLFRPQAQGNRIEYNSHWKITEVMPTHSIGLKSHRDNFAIAFDRNELIKRISEFRDAATDAECYVRFDVADNRDWNVSTARALLKQNPDWEKQVISCLYRTFDIRQCLLSKAVMDFPHMEVNQHMIKPNLSLVTTRQTREPFGAMVSNIVCGQHKIVSAYDSSYVFPLYLYPTEREAAMGIERTPNLAPAFLAAVAERIGTAPAPEAVFSYAYAIFHAPAYRERYAPFLKIDFPRLPLPPNIEAWEAAVIVGGKLVALHLLESPVLNKPGIGFPVDGTHTVEKMRPALRFRTNLTPNPSPSQGEGNQKEEVGSVYINTTEYFTNVPLAAWEYRVGGYQPAQKWLDDRAGRTLTDADINHYRRMIAALRETVGLLGEADAAFGLVLNLGAEDA